MAKKIMFNEKELERAIEQRDKAKTVTEYRKAISVIIGLMLSVSADKIAEILGTSRRTVFRNRNSIRIQDDITKKKPWGGRRNCKMTFEEECQFLAPWVEKAASGGILTVPPIHAALIERLGQGIPLSTTYRLLARHGWRKVQPDTKHPKSDKMVQEEYKKNSPKRWLPPV
jgi:transposase